MTIQINKLYFLEAKNVCDIYGHFFGGILLYRYLIC